MANQSSDAGDVDTWNRSFFQWIVDEPDLEGLPYPFKAWEDDQDYLRKLAELMEEPSRYMEKHSFGTDLWFELGDSFLDWFPLEQSERRLIVQMKKDFIVGGFGIEEVQDQTLERNGQPGALSVYKDSHLLLSGLVGIMRGFLIPHEAPVVAGGDRRYEQMLLELFWSGVVLTIAGQNLEHTFSDGPPISLRDYKLITILKFAPLSTLPVILGSRYSGKSLPKAFAVAPLVGYLLTVRNEYASLFSESYKKAKCAPPAEDITLGLYTYPILQALETDDREIFLALLRKRTDDKELLRFAVERMEQLGIKSEMQAECKRVGMLILNNLAGLPPNPQLFKILLTLKSKASEYGAEY